MSSARFASLAAIRAMTCVPLVGERRQLGLDQLGQLLGSRLEAVEERGPLEIPALPGEEALGRGEQVAEVGPEVVDRKSRRR
jgi:hypothetical protein